MESESQPAFEVQSAPAGAASSEQPLRGRKFVWLIVPPWDHVPTRQHHFTRRLARLGAEVLYVENSTSWKANWKQNGWRSALRPQGAWTREVEPRLHVMKAAFHLPGTRQSPLIAEINGRLSSSAISRWLSQNGWNEYTCWCRLPHSVLALKHLRPDKVVYDITDDYELHEQNPRYRRFVAEREAALLAQADVVTVTARELLQKESLRGREPHYIPNGVEYDLFAQASRSGPTHPLVAGMKKPVIGYVGLTTHWMDFELLQLLGQRWPGQILMLGPIAPHVAARAKAISGLVWGGFVPQPELAPYLRGVDVFIMPHVVDGLLKNANPLKIWEYLATGKSFVSVDLPALDPVRHLVHVSRDRNHFVQLVEQQLATKDADRARASQEYAQSQSWDAIFGKVLEKLAPGLG
jgi:glycosyltransferase involved in cell wall biosynthesis